MLFRSRGYSRRAEFLASVPLPGPDVAERIADAGVDRADIRRGGLALSSAVRELAPDRDGNAFEFDADFCIRAADVRAGDAADRSFFRAAFPDAGILVPRGSPPKPFILC